MRYENRRRILGTLAGLFLVLLFPRAARAGITYVNDNTVAASSGTQGSVTGTLSGVTAGHLLVAIVTCDSNATITAPSGWTDANVRADSGANVGVDIYYYPNYPSNGTVSATFSFSVANGSGIVQIIELAGALTSNPLDVTGTAAGMGRSATVTASSPTTSSGDIAVVGWSNNTGNRTFGNPTAPWTLVNNDTFSTTTDEEGTYQTGITLGTTLTQTLSVQRATTYWAVALVTFKAAPLYWRGGLSSCASGSLFTSTTCWSKTSGGASAGVAPAAGDLVTFDGGGTGNCALSSTATTSLTSITTTSAYTGTITQGTRAVSLSGDLSLAGGTFTGASGQMITSTGTLTVRGGTFNGNGATVNAGDLTVSSGAFTGNGSSVSTGTLTVSGGTYTEGTGNFTASDVATFSGGTATFSSGTSAFQSTLTTSGTASLTFGTGAPTVADVATFGGTGTVTFGSGQVKLQNGLDVEGASVTFGASASTTIVTGTVTLGSGTVNLTNGSAATNFTSTDVFTQSGGTFNVNGAAATLATGISGTNNDGVTQSGGTFNNTTAGGSITVGQSGGGGGMFDQTGSGAVYNSVSTASETFNGPVDIYGSMTVGNATLAGSSNARRVVTIESGGTMTLSSTGFAFSSTTAMTIAGTLNANGTVSFSPNVTLSGTMNANASSPTFNGNLTLSGTYNAGSSTSIVSGTVSLSGTYNATTSTSRFASTTALSGTFNTQSSTNMTFQGAVTMTGTSAFNGGTGTTTFSASPTLTAGTFTVASAGSSGSVIFSLGATFASGMTLAFPASGGTLSAPGGQTLTVNGTVTSSAGSSATPPKIARSSGTTGVTIAFGTASVLNVDGLEFDNSVAAGVSIANGATYTMVKHLTFKNNVANSTSSGATHLAITSSNTGGTKVLQVPGCYFDATAQYNVTLSGVNGSTGVRAIFEYQSATVNGARAGEAYDLDADTSGDNVADTTTASRYGSVVEWVNASATDTAGTAVGFPTAAFDWNTFQWYGVYVAFKDTTGANTADVVWNRNSDGSVAYSFSIPQASGNLVGTPTWDTVNETTKNVDANGDGDMTDTDVRVVYMGTSTGRIIKLVDSGSSLARPASGAWSSDFTSSNVSTITSAFALDGTNLYFGGTGSSTTKVFGVQVAGGANEATLQKNIGSVSAITTTPSITTSGGSTYLFLGSTATASQSYIYRINATSGSIDASYTGATTNINGAVVLSNNRAYAASDGGKIYALDALNFNVGGFINVSGFPYTTSGSAAVKFAPWVDYKTVNAFFGDDGGKVYAISSAGANLTGFPLTISSSIKITSTPIYITNGGVIAVGANDGYLYFIDKNNGTAPNVFKRYFITGGGSVSTVSYNANTSTYMVSSSDGKLAFVNGSDVTDPTPSSI